MALGDYLYYQDWDFLSRSRRGFVYTDVDSYFYALRGDGWDPASPLYRGHLTTSFKESDDISNPLYTEASIAILITSSEKLIAASKTDNVTIVRYPSYWNIDSPDITKTYTVGSLGGLSSACDIKEYSNHVFVADLVASKVQVYRISDLSAVGSFISAYGTASDEVKHCSGIAFMENVCFVGDYLNKRVTSFRITSLDPFSAEPAGIIVDLSSYHRVVGVATALNQLYVVTNDLKLHVFVIDTGAWEIAEKIAEVDISTWAVNEEKTTGSGQIVLGNRYYSDGIDYYTNVLYVDKNTIWLISHRASNAAVTRAVALENAFKVYFDEEFTFSLYFKRDELVQEVPFSYGSTILGVVEDLPVEITAEGWGQLNTADLYFDDFSIDAFCGIFAFDEEITSELTAGCNYVNQPFQFSLTSGVDVFSSSFTFELEGTIQPAVFHEIDLVLDPFMGIVASTPYKAYAYSVEIGIPDIVISGGIDTVGTGIITIPEPTIEVFTGIGIEVWPPLVQTSISVVPVPTIMTSIDVEAPYLYSSAVLHPISHAEISIPKPSTSASFSFAKTVRSSIIIPTPVIDGVIQTPPDVHVSLNISTPQVKGALIIIPSLSVIVESSIYIEAKGLARDVRTADYLYLVNQRLGATTQLSIPDLKSLAVHEGYIYYSTPTGIYRIAASDTQDSIGEAFFITGDIDTNIPSIKNYLYVFITGRINSGTLTIYTDDGNSYDYDIAAMPYRAGERRAVLGRGLRSRYLRFKITSSEPFEIERIRVVAEPSRRVR